MISSPKSSSFARYRSPRNEGKLQGRRISFYEDDSGALIVVEMGPKGTRSVLEEQGLGDATPEQLWQHLFGDEPVPQAVTDASQVTEVSGEGTEVQVEAQEPEALSIGGNTASSVSTMEGAAPAVEGDIGQTQQAFSSSGDEFLRAGGCATRPAQSASDYPNILGTDCHTNWGNGYFAQAFSTHARWRFASYAGGGFNVRVSIDGAINSTRFVPAGYWANFEVSKNHPCRSWCCSSVLFFCTSTCVSCSFDKHTLRVDVLDAANDGFHAGSVFFNAIEEYRLDTQPWY